MIQEISAPPARELAGTCSAADEAHAIYPPLQIFKEFCLDAEWSLDAIAHLAEQHSFALVSSEEVSTPDKSPAQKAVWEAKTVVGPIGIIGVEGISELHGHTVTCSVTAPLESIDFMRMHNFEDGKIDVILLTRLPGQHVICRPRQVNQVVPKSNPCTRR